MYLYEPIYDADELLRSNYHIHTCLSRCGKPEMTVENILAAAKKAGLREIALTDHIHPGETWKLRRNLPLLQKQLAGAQTDIKVYIGAELSAYGKNKFTLKNTDFDLDYRLYAHNHYHMFGWEQPEDKSPYGYKEHCKSVLTAVIISGKADCMAHPFTDTYIVREFGEKLHFSPGEITGLWSENELGELLTLGKTYRVAWEINAKACRQNPGFIRKLWGLGRENGVCFHFGTDAHCLKDIDPSENAEFIKGLLR